MTVLMALAWAWVVLSERKLPDLETEPRGFRAG